MQGDGALRGSSPGLTFTLGFLNLIVLLLDSNWLARCLLQSPLAFRKTSMAATCAGS